MNRADLTRDEYSEGLNIFRQPLSEQTLNLELKIEKQLGVGQEQTYKAVFECANDIILLINDTGTIIDVNERLTEIGGYARGEIVGKNIRDLTGIMTKKSLSVIINGFLRRVADVHLVPYEVEMIKKNGEILTFEISACPLKKAGEVIGDLAILRDVTGRKLTEQALKASEQNFRNSMDSSFMGIRIVDIEGHISYSNQAFLDIFGYKKIDEATVNPPRELYTPESYVDFTNRLNKIKNGESAPDTMEVDIIRKDGAARHLQLYYKTLFWNGKQQYQTLYNDITELYQMEKKLEQAAREWRLTFDSITDLISIHDKENRFLRVNKAVADMLNTTPKELIGKYCHHVMHCAKTPPANCPHLQTMATGKPAVLECFNPTLEAHIHESTSPLFNEKGEITGSIIIARDVTLQKRIDEQLIVTERLASIGELSSGIAHELNNPLTSVIGFSQLLMEGDVPPEIKEELNTVYTEAQRAATIVKNLLTFARKHTPVKQMSQINRVVEDVLRLRTYEQKVNNIEIEKHLAENLPDIMMDHFQMQQCFLNIVVNAEFAMLEAHNEGKLIITTEQDGDIVRTSFTDNGPGISRENLKRIFDPFFTTKEVGKGTGLGLSICHGIVQEHGGKIYARSEKGQGATMIVELPLNG
jgi:PAS domain S-box-containing protein